jgi:short-subunit dehydrogenase
MATRFRSILISGASSGIGEALARHYAAPGVSLALSGRNAARLEAAAEACRAQGAEVCATRLDVQDRAETTAWVLTSEGRRPLDLVVANAGISGGTAGESEDEEQARDIFAVNLAGTLNTVFPALPALKRRGRGQIAVMASLAAFRGMPTAPAYSASKAAVRAWGEALRGELAGTGVGVSVICPGFVESRITDANTFRMPMLMPADKAAAIIAKGLEANRGRIGFPWPMMLGAWFLGALPDALAHRITARMPKKG